MDESRGRELQQGREAHALGRTVASLVETFRSRALALDRAAGFPAENIEDLRRAGALTAPLPGRAGGLGCGTEPVGLSGVFELLRQVGRGHLATGRLFEGHVNAIKLVATYGTPGQLDRVAADVRDGRLFGLWVTEDAAHATELRDAKLSGGKIFCSGAGHVSRAVVTAQPAAGEPVLVMVSIDDAARARPSAVSLQGMRAATTGSVDLGGLPATAAEIVGAPGDYLRQPVFSSGAWRTSAVTLGGIEALVEVMKAELVRRGRAGNPHQLVRLGEALIAQQTARFWVGRACGFAEAFTEVPGEVEAGEIVAVVNLARIAVERAALEVIGLVQRSLGLAAFMQGHPAEALMRDLATYLRQPAPDETLTEAAAWFATREMPA